MTTFDELFAEHNLTPEERKALVMHLATLRAQKTVQALQDCPHAALGPTHWMDDRGLHVSDKWLRDEATSDYRAAYVIPAKMTRTGVRPLYPCRTCRGTGEDFNEDAHCHDCGGSGGLTAPAGA